MPRMIFWNVQKFNYDKFYSRKRKRKRDEEEEWGADVGLKYRDVLIPTITAHNPDFIVLAEIHPGNAQAGQLVDDRGTMNLLKDLRMGVHPTWALVPPIVSGNNRKAEGIAVFFRRSQTMFFTGPWRWTGQGTASGGKAALYQSPYHTAFSSPPEFRTVPVGALHNAGEVERQLAGQTEYTVAGASATFGAAGNRTPFRTTFYDSTSRRNYSILGFHAPPGQGDGTVPVTNAPSTLGTAEVARLTEVTNPGANEVVVVAGDFNVSLFDQAAIGVAYQPFLNAGYTRMINATPLPTTYPAKGYLSTHLKDIKRATVDCSRGGPALGYLSDREGRGAWDSIDNAFVCNSTAAQTNATIANIVYGTPYKPSPQGMPAGHYPYRSQLNNPEVLNNGDGWDPNDDVYYDMVNTFQDSENYQRVYNVSDHLPLVFDFQ